MLHRYRRFERLETCKVEPSFGDLAAQLREMTEQRRHTPSEELQREGRDER